MARLISEKNASFRPFKLLKKIMPERLLTRTLTILIVPVLLVQLATGIVFWNRHWSDTTTTLATNIAASVAAIVNIANFEDKNALFFKQLQKFSKQNFSIKVTQIKNVQKCLLLTFLALKVVPGA